MYIVVNLEIIDFKKFLYDSGCLWNFFIQLLPHSVDTYYLLNACILIHCATKPC